MEKTPHIGVLQTSLWNKAVGFRPTHACFFADTAPETTPAAGDQKEAVPFELGLSEAARKKAAAAAAVIAQVKKDERTYVSSKAIVQDLLKALRENGFNIPEGMEFNSIDEAVDYVLANTDYSFQPLKLGDVHIDAEAAKVLRDLKIEFLFDESTQHMDFKVPHGVDFFDLDGNKVTLLESTDATHWVDVSISYDEAAGTFLVLIGKDDGAQFRRTLKYKVKK